MIFSLPGRFKSPVVLAVVVIILLGISISLTFVSKKPPVPDVNFEDVTYPSQVWKNRVIKNATTAAQEQDSSKRFELYQNIFSDLLAIYGRDHNPQTRGQLQSLDQFIAKEFPSLYNPNNFTVPCLDLGCGTANYPKEIEEIKAGLKSITSFEPQVLDSVLKKFEAAALSSDGNYQWQNYIGAFQEIKAERQRTKDEKISQIGLKLREFLELKYPEIFSQRERNFPETFKIK